MPDDRALVLIEKERGALRLAALDSTALRLGLKAGMALADARAVVPDLAVADIDRSGDEDRLLALAAACERFTPLVARDSADGLMLDITGCAHLFGGESDLLTATRRLAHRFGLRSRAAVAGTPDAARAFARFTQGGVLAVGGEEAVARTLPVTALDRDPETTFALTRAGLRTLGDLAGRPSHGLAARFGSDLVAVLNRILGREDIRITPLRPPPDCIAEQHFAEPVTEMESAFAALERLAGEVIERLDARRLGGRCFEASFFRADGKVRRVTVETAMAMRDVRGLMQLVRLRIEALGDPIDPGFGFDAIRLAATGSEAINESQQGFDGGEAHAEDKAVADLVDRLVARFGRETVLRFIARDTHDPVKAGGVAAYLSHTPSAEWAEPEPGQPPARPLTLFDPPQLIETIAEVPDGPPLKFRWRRILHDIARAEGPERIAPDWWQAGDQPPLTRDYYRVEDAIGHRFWVFREGLFEDPQVRPRWFLHGLFA